jgi:hypothetical protein
LWVTQNFIEMRRNFIPSGAVSRYLYEGDEREGDERHPDPLRIIPGGGETPDAGITAGLPKT